jgi:hypothetical protein
VKISDFLVWLGGADKEALQQVPAERAKLSQMAGVLLTTAGIAVASMSFALHDGLKTQWPWAVPGALLWGVIILNVDRLLVLSIASIRSTRRKVWLALPRLGMAFVLSVVISTPIVLRIFASDINAEIYATQLQRSTVNKEKIKKSTEQDQVDKLLRQIQDDRKILAGDLPEKFASPQLQAAQAKVDSLTTAKQTAKDDMNATLYAWQCELKGAGESCHRASPRQGDGPLAKAKEKTYRTAVGVFNSASDKLAAAQKNVDSAEKAITKNKSKALKDAQDKARTDLPALLADYNTRNKALQDKAAQGTLVNNADNGLPAQIQALFTTSIREPALGVAHFFIFLLFLMIEMLPVIIKILLSVGPESAYEKAVRSKEDTKIHEIETRQSTDREVLRDREKVRTSVEADMRAREQSLGKRANAHVATEMENILSLALQDWSREVRSRMTSNTPPPPSTGTSTSTSTSTSNGTSNIQAKPNIGLPDEDEL